MFVKHPLLKYILQRVLQAIPLIFWVVIVNFLIIHFAPGDPVSYLAGQYEAGPEFVEQMRREYGLDKPMAAQLGVYLLKIMQGDLGYSIRFESPVSALILSRIPATFLLVGTGLVLTYIFGVFLGVFYTRRSALSENVALVLAIAGHSTPSFWLGQIALIIFALHLGWFPTQGMMSLRVQHTGLNAVLDVLYHLALPALTYSIYHITLIFRLTRSKMLETLAQDFIITARGKGLDRKTILYRHSLPHVLMPIVTILGANAGFMIAGSVLVETVFAWPGMGRLMFEAVSARDYPLLLGLFIMVSVFVIIGNLLADIIYAFIDPRVAYK